MLENTQLTACEAYHPESGCGGGGIGLHARGLAARISPPQLVQNKKDYRPQLTGRTRKTLPPAKSSSLGPKARRTTDRNCSDGLEKRSRPPNPVRWAPKQEKLPTGTDRTASKNAPARQIQLAGPQRKKDYRPQLLRRPRKTLPAAKSSSLGPKARRTTDCNCSDGL